MSRMRLRYSLQRRRADATSKLLRRNASGSDRFSATKDIIGGGPFDLIEIFTPPGDHFIEAFFQADLRLPTYISLYSRGIQPIARILTKPVVRYLAEGLEGDAQRIGRLRHEIANRGRH